MFVCKYVCMYVFTYLITFVTDNLSKQCCTAGPQHLPVLPGQHQPSPPPLKLTGGLRLNARLTQMSSLGALSFGLEIDCPARASQQSQFNQHVLVKRLRSL